MSADDKPRRAPTHGGEGRDRRRTPSAGVKIVSDPPPVPTTGRTPTPPDVLARRVAAIEAELRDNTRSTVRVEALVESFLGPLLKEQAAKLDTCLHHIAASSHLAANVGQLGEKIDGLGGRLNRIEGEQALAAERFEAHDVRDREIAAVVELIRGDVDELKQHRAIADNTAKVRKQTIARIRPWWFSAKGVGVVIAALAAGIATVLGVTQGGCS